MQYLFFLLGLGTGFYFYLFERVLDAFYLYPKTEFGQRIQSLWQEKKILPLFRELAGERAGDPKLMIRSLLFVVMYVVLVFFVLTSTGSVIGIGIMLGIGYRYMTDVIAHRNNPQVFRERFLWQLGRQLSNQEVQVYVGGTVLFMLIISLFVLI